MDDTNADAMERAMLRGVALGLPAATILAASLVGVFSSAGPAILVLTGGVILGVIMLLWNSIRALTGEAPLPPELVEAMTARRALETDLAERKRMALLAIKDLEHEHGVGKIDDADYQGLSAELRARAKEILREMDQGLDPVRAKAEDLVRTHLAKRGFQGASSTGTEPPAPSSYVDAPKVRGVELASDEVKSSSVTTVAPARVFCPKCHASNEPDATFCKACGTAVATEVKS